ncbi:hypothetical protein A3A41_04035 [Candidatus Kaiserbacteria bacterium RIFCSPLOWO2_01_FULL_54_22]|nr:MAG: hypothetical protein A3A41_04035 [Candidatus Kaiserbacteria bacterium RIFCSPLOWO2_01_FULL_54_22]
MARQVKTREQRGELRIERFLSDVRAGTRAALLRTPIVHVSVDISIFLIFKFLLACYRASALAAFQQSTKCLRLFGRFLHLAAQSQNFLHFVKKFFSNNRRMLPFVHFSGIAEVAVVKRIRKNEFCLVFFERTIATFTPSPCWLRVYAMLEKKTADIFESRMILSVQLKHCADDFRFLLVYNYCFRARVIEIPKRRLAGINTLPRFLPQAARCVDAQIAHILIRHAKLDRHHQYIVSGIVGAIMRLYVRDSAILQKPTNLSAVHRITSEPIKFPTNDTARVSALNTEHHVIENGPPGHFR